MACTSCGNRSQRNNIGGCRSALQSARWPSAVWSASTCSNGCNNNCTNCCSNGCNNNCTNCCSNGCNNNCTNCCSNGCNNNCTNCCSNGCNNNCTNCCHNGCTGNCANCCNCCTNCNNNCCANSNCCGCTNRSGCRNYYSYVGSNARGVYSTCGGARNTSNCGCTGCGNSCYPICCGSCGSTDSSCTCCQNNSCNSSSSCCDCCVPCDVCDCTECDECDLCTSCESSGTVYGCFNQNGCLTISAGEEIPFDGTASASGISQSGGRLTLSETGVYMVALGVVIPECASLKTVFQIRMNGNAVSGGAVVIDKGCTTLPMHAGTQIVLSAKAGAVLNVTSGACVNLTADGSSDPIAVLTVVKIG